MLPLLTISSLLALAAVGDLLGLWDFGDDAEDKVDEIDGSGGFALLDEGVETTLDAQVLGEVAGGTDVIDDDSIRDAQNYPATGSVEIEGTDGDDTIDANEDVEVAFGEGGDDIILGAAHNQVIFGGEGDDVVFGKGGDDQLFGDEGDDTIVGGAGNDLIVSQVGADVLFGGSGDDNIYVATSVDGVQDTAAFDVVNAGTGDDSVILSAGAALIELGTGADDVLVLGDNDPVAIITDFDPAEDQIVLGVFAEQYTFADNASSMEISYVLSEIETSQGMATLVVPAVENEELQDAFADASIGHAVLIGVTPDQIEEGNIRVIVNNIYTSSQAAGSAQSVFYQENGATAL